MHDLLSKLDNDAVIALSGMLVGVVAIFGGISVAITAVVANHFRKKQLDDMEATLKMEMIERGMSAADIRQVLEARMTARTAPTRCIQSGAELPGQRCPECSAKNAERVDRQQQASARRRGFCRLIRQHRRAQLWRPYLAGQYCAIFLRKNAALRSS